MYYSVIPHERIACAARLLRWLPVLITGWSVSLFILCFLAPHLGDARIYVGNFTFCNLPVEQVDLRSVAYCQPLGSNSCVNIVRMTQSSEAAVLFQSGLESRRPPVVPAFAVPFQPETSVSCLGSAVPLSGV